MARKKPDDGLGMPINGNYDITLLPSGIRGQIRKVGCRHYFKFDRKSVRIEPMKSRKGKR
jgi:hypothetical protein